MEKRLFFDLDLPDLQQALQEWGEPSYRASQIWEGIYQHLYHSPEQLTNLPNLLRQKLAGSFDFRGIEAIDEMRSSDRETVKTLFGLVDGNKIEAVLMRYDRRQTLCISSQAGCAMGCVFCATGQMGFKRHLSSGEIVAQVHYYARQLQAEGLRVTNVVVMGMGEPFHNYQAVLAAIDRLNHPQGTNLGERRFTISTVGIIPNIYRFAKEKRQINLAISLHAANDELRSTLLPINRKYPLNDLIQACRDYVAATNRRVTFEWALIEGVNDQLEHARELSRLVKGLLCHVNVIPLNPTTRYEGKATTRPRAESFRIELEAAGIPCTVRLRRGIDIQAGCGQLAGKTDV